MDFKLTEKEIGKISETLVNGVAQYVTKSKLKSMILGVSGGIDSTVVAAICQKVSERTGVKLIGVSLMCSTNKEDERTIADKVGEAFCDEYYKVDIQEWFKLSNSFIMSSEPVKMETSKIGEGNIKARLRMIYLWNLAGLRNGVVMDTDNLTEHLLGFWTLQGDSNYLTPIGNLWKTEVYMLANYLRDNSEGLAEEALRESIEIVPTDGLGISDSDLDQIGAKSYQDVDDILYTATVQANRFKYLDEKYGSDVVKKVLDRHLGSEFKRKHLPMSVSLTTGEIVEYREFERG